MRISDWSSDVCSSDLHIARAGDSRASASDTMHPCSTMLALISASVRSSTFATAFELTATDRKWLHRWLQPGSPSQAQLSLSRLARSTVLCPALASSWKPPPCRCPPRAKSPARKSVGEGKRVSVRVNTGGCRNIQKKRLLVQL